MLLQQFLILIEDGLVELDLPTLVDSFPMVFVQPRLGRDRLPLLQPAADGLTALGHFDVDNLFFTKELGGLGHEPGLGVHALHVGLSGKDEEVHGRLGVGFCDD